MILASIFLVKVRFATGKSLASDVIELAEDEHDEFEKVKTELPFQQVNLTFKDMHYTVTSSIGKEKIELLKGIDGLVAAGKMTALVSEMECSTLNNALIHVGPIICIFLNYSSLRWVLAVPARQP